MTENTSAPSSNFLERWWNDAINAVAEQAARRRAERVQRAQSRDEARARRHSPKRLLTSEIEDVREASRAVSLSQPVLFNRLSVAYVHGQQILKGQDDARLRAMIEQAVLTAGDALKRRAKLSNNDVAALADTASRVTKTLQFRESERARVRYALGLLVGVAMAVGVLVLVMFAGWQIPNLWRKGTGASEGNVSGEAVALRDALVAIGAGAVGACLSVLVRLHRMKTVTVQSAWQAAIVRIALGMLFGVGLLCLIKGGILVGLFEDPTAQLYDGSVEGAPAEALHVSSWFFWAAIGFLAGFNERWATSLFSREADEDGTAERSEQGGG